jgi:hypothetical protein
MTSLPPVNSKPELENIEKENDSMRSLNAETNSDQIESSDTGDMSETQKTLGSDGEPEVTSRHFVNLQQNPPNQRNIKKEVHDSIKILKTLDPSYERASKSDVEDDDIGDPLAVSPTEEALEDLLSIIPQLHSGKGDTSSLKFDESNRYKWDYVAEIFVDLQDLHSNIDIPDIINDINNLKSGLYIGDLLQRITNIVAQIQVERRIQFSAKKKQNANLIQACV